MRYHEGNACVLSAVRTIEAGEEITDNYGFFYQGGYSIENYYNLWYMFGRNLCSIV